MPSLRSPIAPEHYRVLTSRSAAEPGPYRIARTPYLREPMDALGIASPMTAGKSDE